MAKKGNKDANLNDGGSLLYVYMNWEGSAGVAEELNVS